MKLRGGWPWLLLVIAGTAHAHGLEAAGFVAGLAHPMGGADHLLAMVAVGIVSTRAGRAFVWALPCTFVAGLAIGFVCGLAGPHLPLVERGVVLSVIVLGVMVARPGRWLPVLATVVVLGFGWCHGYAHGQEWPMQASPWAFALGFIGTSAGLHAIGVISGLLLLEHPRPARCFRITGLLVATAGATMALSAVLT